MNITATFGSGVSKGYKNAVATAINYYDNEFTNNVSVNLDFKYGTLGAGAIAHTSASIDFYSYASLESSLYKQDTATGASAVQQAAAATLPGIDPTGGAGTWAATTAYARMLGLNPAASSPASPDATITLNSNLMYSYNDTNGVAAGTYDAVKAVEHEVSEALGRLAVGGSTSRVPGEIRYNALDLFRYTAAGGGASIQSPGTAAGSRDEPFQAGYDPNAQSYFSYDGKTVTLPYNRPGLVARGLDVGDWNPSVKHDTYGEGTAGQAGFITPTDLNEMNALGYDLVCFAAGALIRTPRGDVAVEALQADDMVVTVAGAERPIKWLGHRTINCAAHAAPFEAWPVRIRAGAFGGGLPERSLFLSPGHPVLVGEGADGILVPIMCLINGTSVERVPVDTVTYWHIELDQHDILLAEGLPAESFLDYGNRAWFENGGDHALTNPDFIAPGLGSRCRRVAVDGPSVEAERRRLDGLFEMSLATQCAWPSAEIIEVGF